MPGVIKRQTRSSKVVPATSKRGASIINSFARVSKPQTPGKIIGEKPLSTPPTKTETIRIDIVVSSKKRKAVAVDENVAPAKDISPSTTTAAAPRSTKRACRRQLDTIQNNQQTSPTSEAVATQEDADLCGAQPLLERLQLQTRPSEETTSPADALPRPLTDMINLNTSFTKALAVHHVHNGSNVPIDTRTLCPSITLSWGKRSVVVDDLRRCIGILNARPSTGIKSPFYLSDYGRGKVCIELRPEAPAILNETQINRGFESNLRSLWSKKKESESAADVKRFLAGLPLAPITVCESLIRGSAALAKGQRTLEEFKHGIVIKKKQEAERKAQVAAPANVEVAKMSLIDRIRYKEMLNSQQDNNPKPEDLQRRAALQRAVDIVDVISMLSTATALGQKRLAFTMPALLTKLKDSLRVPISREEGASCIKMLASEIAPQWIKVVTIGGRDNVVVLPDFALSKTAIQGRVSSLLM